MKNIMVLLCCLLTINICKRQTHLEYSTYIGGNNSDFRQQSLFDSKGNLIIVGSTRSKDFPLTGNILFNKMKCDTTGPDSWYWDIIIIKFDIRKNKLLFSTFLEGSSMDTPDDIVIDRQGNLYITGNPSGVLNINKYGVLNPGRDCMFIEMGMI